MSELFLYTPDAQLNSMHLRALRQAGIIPIKVAHLDTVRRLSRPVPVPEADLALLSYAAFKTIRDYGQYAHAAFGKNISELMTKRAASAIEAATAGETRSGSTGGESAVGEAETPKGGTHEQND